MKVFTLIVCFSISFASFGQLIDPFAIRFQANQKGSIRMLANVSVGCSCSAHNEMPPGGTGDNNGFSATFVDVDTDGSTFMSSSDQLDLPNCSEISWAGLYWVGMLNNTPSNTPNFASRNQVKLSVDGGAYINLTADELFDNTVGKVTYFGFKDITSIVQANSITSSYTVANVVTQNGSNTFGGWTIVVVYKNVYESMRNLTIFDGLSNVTPGSSGTVNIPLSGFLTPPSGPVSFELGVVAHDGDRAQSGDQLEFNGAGSFVNISDPIHPVNNVFNSTISYAGSLTPLRNPSYNNTLGHDANIYAPDNSTFNYIGNSTTSATIRVSTTSETVLTSVITSAIDIYEPDLRASVSYLDINGGTVVPGDILEYTIVSKNIGSDVSINTILTDTLDERLTYLPGTMQITYGPNSGVKTDPIDADQAEFIALDNVIRARIGTGASGTTGGSVVNSPTGADSTVLKFRVQLLDDCPVWQCGELLENKAYLFGTGQISGITNGNNGASDQLDINGCPSLESGTVLVDVSACADTIILYTDSLCVGETLSLDFPNSPYLVYEWTGPNGYVSTVNNPTIPNVQLTDAGTYLLSVSYNGVSCISDTSAPVFVSDNPTIQLNNLVNDSCYNSGSGTIDISGVGNADFTYTWSNGDLDSLAGGLGAGTYSVLVEDQYGCTVADTFTITEPTPIVVNASITSNYNGEDISCFGAADGSAEATASGGTGTLTFEWTPTGSNNPIISNLDAGTHVIAVTDANGCVMLDSVTLIQPDSLILSAQSTNVPCFGDSTGAINISTVGGTGPFSYLWDSGQATEDLTNIPDGTYLQTVTDVNGCMDTLSVTIDQPIDSMAITATQTAIQCFGDSTANVDLSVVGGTPIYTFVWSNGALTEDLTNVPANVYTVAVTDNSGCSQTALIDVVGPPEMVLTETTINPVCQGGTQGSIDLSVNGGTPGYTYAWNNGQFTEDIGGLFAGEYVGIVTDINGCTETITIQLTDPDALILGETPSNVTCYNGTDGSIDLSVSNGTPAYTYLWSDGQITEDAINLGAGNYYVNVFDQNNCGAFLATSITQPDTSIYLTDSTVTHVLCYGESNGAINMEVAGGVQPYTYAWNNGAPTLDLNGIPAGTYTLTITDANGCVLTYADDVLQPDTLVSSESHVDVLCFGASTGSIDVTTVGGVSPYSFSWSSGPVSQDLTSIPAGNYTLTTTDDNGCAHSLQVTIDQALQGISIAESSVDILCYGGDNGSIDVTVSGGTPSYDYAWNTGESTEDVSTLLAGDYFVEVTDANGCFDTLFVTIAQPAGPLTLFGEMTPACLGDTSGSATVYVEGGTPAYSYQWDTDPNDTQDFITNLPLGSYEVVVIDANGCSDSISITVGQPSDLTGCVVLDMPNVFTPNNDQTNDSFVPIDMFNINDYRLVIVNRWGQLIFESVDPAIGWDGTYQGTECSEGVYFWIVDYTDNYSKAGQLHGHVTLAR